MRIQLSRATTARALNSAKELAARCNHAYTSSTRSTPTPLRPHAHHGQPPPLPPPLHPLAPTADPLSEPVRCSFLALI